MADSSVADQVRLEQSYDLSPIEDSLEEDVTGRQITFGEIEDTEE